MDNISGTGNPSDKLPVHYAIILYPGFQALDAFGPLDVLNVLGRDKPIKLSIIGPSLDPVSINALPRQGLIFNPAFFQSVVPTHTYANPPENIDVLIIPGGTGNRDPRVLEPVSKLTRDLYPGLQYLFTICTGSKIPAHAGILEGRKATSNKIAFGEVAAAYPKVNWVERARWVVDGNIWTTSGISAGIDGMLAFVEHLYGKEKVDVLSHYLEYVRNEDPSVDPFCSEETK
ncbi:hypothetical protein D8B26_002062 [Coccidioides posadasii str. Silveira]|uniref:ThiJ/PfpI family protein n=3 Tax=Coccidioides posadasii TaxID=199306 RepID=E9CXD5_COCPS|nr:DJ-1/PfpI family protein [Coccidioides posadasii C735 delta SOWgp]EER23905.1 DJ-1/PfpI family protein [Coccidioides posadasii C735 delta SOWgp]EFW21961.1 ThiJ/PfpI family protein [Coccidioides posadasii str. Silveira]KMM65421.1 ThiJ/PfpI family protein [Coccidioides posadasii RMSCC 3488]QVM07362.1 hypothetical protein D8B26_002062 [Coccidioides posadasii str. Silveira]|eukprot:XP_003066050.1 DJ-1/PfpI family protein [Coccidioides posadasii C735 delta SOWgp]